MHIHMLENIDPAFVETGFDDVVWAGLLMWAMKHTHTQLSVHLVSHSFLQADRLESDGVDLSEDTLVINTILQLCQNPWFYAKQCQLTTSIIPLGRYAKNIKQSFFWLLFYLCYRLI